MTTEKSNKCDEKPVMFDREVEDFEDGTDTKKATAEDRADMWRLGRTQELTVRHRCNR